MAAGDAICQSRAAAAGLANAGNFVAWLSSDDDDAYCRLHGLGGKKNDHCGQPELPEAAGPWVRTDGYPFGAAIGDLLSPGLKVFTPLRLDEFGNAVDEPLFQLFSATNNLGVRHQAHTACQDWTDSSKGNFVPTGSSYSTGWGWTTHGSGSCSNPGRLICLERDPGPALPPFAEAGRVAFVTSVTGNGNLGSWPQAGSGSSGVAAGDAICRNLATDAGLAYADSFKAWLSDSSTDAVDRFQNDGPWVRPDGVPIAADKAELTGGTLFTAITVTEQGGYLANHGVWTGTTDMGVSSGADCADWTDGTSVSSGQIGDAQSSQFGWSQHLPPTPTGCNGTFPRLYCLSDAPWPLVVDSIFADRFEP